MKHRRAAQPERRRPLVEMSLIGEAKARSVAVSRGCASLFGRLFAGVVIFALVWQGLS